MYKITFSDVAKENIAKLRKHSPNSYKKLSKLLYEISEHPRTGTGKVELLKYFEEETYSRRISKEHRLVYRVNDDIVEVLIISAYGHYDDK